MTESLPDEYREAEWKRVHERRANAFPEKQAAEDDTQRPDNLVGLSLSGGGLRSAMFNDGFLQGLSHSGLLRYVDFLCSVSGGGYIAAHLATRAKQESRDKSDGFHDDETSSQGTLARWMMGRCSKTGKVDSGRLNGVGRYLANRISIAPSFLWSVLLSALVIIGLAGFIATLLALFWRSFDDPMFRIMLHNVLDFRFGGELAIAFYPPLIVGVGWALATVFGWFRESPRQLTISRIGLTLFLVSLLVSVAVFLGNGKSNTSRTGDEIQLNHYAQWFAIIAGTIQVLVFVGRDRLFRSERDESQYWQKALQKVSTSGVVFFACFAMVHWMAREDISGYADQRGPYLVVGDVQSWPTLYHLEDQFEQYRAAPEAWAASHTTGVPDAPTLSVDYDIAKAPINYGDDWSQHQRVNVLVPLRDGVPTYTKSDPPSPVSAAEQARIGKDQVEPWSFWRRMAACSEAYLRTRFTPDDDVAKDYFEDVDKHDAQTIRHYHLIAHHRRNLHRAYLNTFNELLHHPDFPGFLEQYRSKDSSKADLAAVPILRQPLGGDDFDAKRKIAESSRSKLETYFEGVIQDRTVASTLIVPPHDQAVRWRWLLGWWTLFCIGVCLSVVRNQTITIYAYYRDRIARLFLSSTQSGSAAYDGSTPLHEFEPTRDGLPHPLYLAARMTPCVIQGSYHVRSRPFVFSPVYCGDGDHVDSIYETSKIQLPGVGRTPLTVSDAVTISGAAVTPLMTDTRALSIILSFFGDGLGQWLIRCKDADSRRASLVAAIRSTPVAGTFACAGLFASLFFGWYWFGITFSLFLIALLTAVAYFVGVNHWSGICQFLRSILQPIDITDTDSSRAERPRAYAANLAQTESMGHVADGGFYDYLGVTELFRRKCRLIIVSDAGANLGNNPLAPLARMCTTAASQYGVKILDLDHDAPIDFGRLAVDKSNSEEKVVHQPYIVARIRYEDGSTGLLVYCQMAITQSDPIDIQQIRHRFPSFPDEPTTNQFYTDDQVAAYRNLGHHIASRVCSELVRWDAREYTQFSDEDTRTQPMFDVIKDRVLTGYRLACHQEQSYSTEDLFSEAIWSTPATNADSFDRWIHDHLFLPKLEPYESLTEHWLRAYEANGDVRAHYRHAVLRDINPIEDQIGSECAKLWQRIRELRSQLDESHHEDVKDRELLSAHLAAVAVACHEVHQGRPKAIFQVGGRAKLISLVQTLRDNFLNLDDDCDEPQMLTRLYRPADEAELRTQLKSCMTEIIEMEKCTFQGSERVTTVSFAQCATMMWGQLVKEQELVDYDSSFGNVAQRISTKGREMAASSVRIDLEKGLRKRELDQVLNSLESGFCLTFLPAEMLRPAGETPAQSKRSGRIKAR